ncbi:MAG: tetratricopeptide repeat protein [Brasilonema angustatum HA4187-MV1]|nr:tetratricopeptide repeat protein [Brasilonema angustatum HA4187-MV1]
MQAWLEESQVRLIGVIAAGGFGKSALIAKLIVKISDPVEEFAEKVWTTFSQAYPFAVWGRWLLDKFGQVAPEKDDDLIIALCNALQSKRYLLVLDNLETLLQANGQWKDEAYHQFLLRWLSSESRSIILVTSREQPALPDNTINQSRWQRLDGLSIDAGVRLLQELEIQGDDSQLSQFVNQAGGHPLLLKLAAGLLHAADEADISEWKHNIFQVLGLHRDDPEANIAKILDASINRLTPNLQNLLFNLSVYRLAFDREAATVMLSEQEVTEAELHQLTKRSLLQEKKQQGIWKFQFQPLIQGYLQQKGENQTQAHQKAIAYYEQRRKPQLLPSDKLEAVAEYLEIFHHNCETGQYLQALNIIEHQTNPDDRYSSCDKLLQLRGYNAVRLTLYERLLQKWKPENQQEVLSFVNACKVYGDVLQFLDRREEALQNYQQALEFYREIGVRLGEANTLKAIGDVLQFLARREEALQNYQQALGFYREIGDRLGEANTLTAIGDVLQFLHRREEALQNYQQALVFYREIGDRLGEANTLTAIGDVLQFLHRREEALQNYQQALGFYREIGDRLGEANTLTAIGDVLQFLDRREEALQNYQQALVFYREIGARLGEANILQEFGKLQDEPAQGLQYLQQAQNLYIQIGDIYSQSRNLLFLADVHVVVGNKDAALDSLHQAAELAASINYEPLIEYTQTKIAKINSVSLSSNKQKLKMWFQRGWVKLAFFFFFGLMIFLCLWLLLHH